MSDPADSPSTENLEPPIEEIPGEAAPPTPPLPPRPSPMSQVDTEKALTFIEDIIESLSFKRVGLLALLTSVGLTLFTVYENRAGIIEGITDHDKIVVDSGVSSWKLSPPNIAALQELAKTTNVDWVIVSDVNLKKNRRAVKYFFIEDTNLKLEPAAQQALVLPLPVFDYDPQNTAQMVSVLSNEYRCDPYKSTIYFRHAPELAEKFPTICRIAIPPFVGSFAGMLAVGINGSVTPESLASIRLEVLRIAVEIYISDVMKGTVTAPP